ncbi:MAG: hypothetical protein QOF37_170 [Thermoleophilaceae bacterium]|nr:hypothetical protein [Thermoleophilaceae bacterium]
MRGQSLRGGIFWSLLTFVAAKSITFLSTLVLARLLGPSEFGVMAAVLAYVALLELIGDLGMNATVVYESEKGITPRVETAFTLNLIVAAVLTVAGVLLAPFIADFFNVGSHADLFRLAALDLILTGLGNVHDAILLRELDFCRRIVPQLAANIVRAGLTIALVALGLGALGLVVGFLAGTAAGTIALWALSSFRPRLTIQRSALRSMLTYGGWASVLQIFAVIGNRADVAVIGRVLGERALGIYVIGQRLPELVIENVSWNLSVVAFPALSRKRDSEQGMVPTTLNLVRYGALFGLPVGALISVLATPLVVVLFGAKWQAAGVVMSAVALMYAMNAVIFPLGDVFKALGRQPTMVAYNAALVPTMVAAMVLASPSGIGAVVWARVGVSFVSGAVLVVLVLRALDLRLVTFLVQLRGAVAAGAGVVAGSGAVRLLWPDNSVGPLVTGALAGAAVGLLALRLFGRHEYGELTEVIGRRLRSRAPLTSPPEPVTATVPTTEPPHERLAP